MRATGWLTTPAEGSQLAGRDGTGGDARVAANEMAGAFRARVAVAYLSKGNRFFSLFLTARPSAWPQPPIFFAFHSLALSLFSSKTEDVFDGAVGIDLGTTYS